MEQISFVAQLGSILCAGGKKSVLRPGLGLHQPATMIGTDGDGTFGSDI
jgi:hypothetical protein